MKTMRHLTWLGVLCQLCWAGLHVCMTLQHSTITGYDTEKEYTFRGKVKDTNTDEFLKVKDCDLDYPTGTRDLSYTGERRGVSPDEFTGWDSVRVKKQSFSEDGRSSGNRTFKLQLKGQQSWVSTTLSWTQRTASGDPPSEG